MNFATRLARDCGRATPSLRCAPNVHDINQPRQKSTYLRCEAVQTNGASSTIRPRLEAAGADLQRVYVVEVVHTVTGSPRMLSLTEDLAAIERKLDEIGDVKLVVIDPITAYLDKTDTHKTADVRAALGPLQTLAARKRVAVVAISHFNKNGGNGKSINAVTGSGAFVAASRAMFVVTPAQEDPEQRLFIEAKNNLGNAKGLVFRIKQASVSNGIVAPYVAFEDYTVTITADAAIGSCRDSNDPTQLDAAKQFLCEELRSGPLLTSVLFEHAKEQHISEKTLRRAQKALGVHARKEEQFQGRWVWEFPFDLDALHCAGEPKMAINGKDGHHDSVATFALPWPPLNPTTKGN